VPNILQEIKFVRARQTPQLLGALLVLWEKWYARTFFGVAASRLGTSSFKATIIIVLTLPASRWRQKNNRKWSGVHHAWEASFSVAHAQLSLRNSISYRSTRGLAHFKAPDIDWHRAHIAMIIDVSVEVVCKTSVCPGRLQLFIWFLVSFSSRGRYDMSGGRRRRAW